MKIMGCCVVAAIGMFASGCSTQRMAANLVGDAIAEGSSVFESDDDLALVGDALPFSLKMTEMLLAESPEHPGLLFAACRGFVTYAYVYVEPEAERLEYHDFERARTARERARRLYQRAHGYGQRALDQALDTDADAFQAAPRMILERATRRDVPLLYWNAAALGLLIGVSAGDAALLARLPEVDALLERALALDERWNGGTLHEFSLTLAASAPRRASTEALSRHFERALELSRGTRASLFVAYAEAHAIPQQQPATFRDLLEQALAIDPDADPAGRLANLVAQERARWLLEHQDDLFVAAGNGGEGR